MSRYALLLDSGAVWPLRGRLSRDGARIALATHNARHREGMAARVRCSEQGDYMNFPHAVPRLAVGLVCPKAKNRGAQLMGQAGGKARAEKLSPKRRKEIAQKAAQTRWTQGARI